MTGATILAIIGDVIPEYRRGAAMGMVMSAFSVASIFGVPAGLVLASWFSWHIPFYAIAGISTPILLAVYRFVPCLRVHLEHPREGHPAARMLAVLMEPNHQMAFVFMAALTCAGFTIFPNLATYMVYNVGMSEKQLPFIYLAGGICTLFSMNWIGRWADRTGKLRVFRLMSLSAAVPILVLTNLPRVPLVVAVTVSTLLMICMSGRFVPAMAMMTATVEARYRGGFMSVNSAVAQFSAALAATMAARVIHDGGNHQLVGFGKVAWIYVGWAVIGLWLASGIRRAAEPTARAVEIPA